MRPAGSLAGAWAVCRAACCDTQIEGPFYPDTLPLDTDNDLIVVNDDTTPAVGEVTYLSGRVLDRTVNPCRMRSSKFGNAMPGVYHSAAEMRPRRDTHFQCFGRFLTGNSGEYLFRTIKPVPCRRTPTSISRSSEVARNCSPRNFIEGHPQNAQDGLWNRIKTPAQRDNVTVDFKPIQSEGFAQWSARFDVVLRRTPSA